MQVQQQLSSTEAVHALPCSACTASVLDSYYQLHCMQLVALYCMYTDASVYMLYS